jgi:hypothetical protein
VHRFHDSPPFIAAFESGRFMRDGAISHHSQPRFVNQRLQQNIETAVFFV